MKRITKNKDNKIVIPGIIVVVTILLLVNCISPNYSFIIFGIGAITIPTAIFSEKKILKTIIIIISVVFIALIASCIYFAHKDNEAMNKVIQAEQDNVSKVLSATPAIASLTIEKEDSDTIKITSTLTSEGDNIVDGQQLLAQQSTSEFKSNIENQVKKEVGYTYLPSTINVHYLMLDSSGDRIEENMVKLEF